MSLVARAPSTLSSSASESSEKKSYESQSPLDAKAEKNGRTGQPVVGRDACSARYSRWDDDKACLLKSGKLTNRLMIERGNPL